jgi:hypothetical protein
MTIADDTPGGLGLGAMPDTVAGLPSFGQATIGLSAKGIESGIRGKGRDASGEGADLTKGLCFAGRSGGPPRPNVALEAGVGRGDPVL